MRGARSRLAFVALAATAAACGTLLSVDSDEPSVPTTDGAADSTAGGEGGSLDATTASEGSADGAPGSDAAPSRFRVFVTVAMTSGQIALDGGGRPTADELCQKEAQAASLPGVYVAWLSIDGPAMTGAIDRLPANAVWETPTGALVFPGKQHIAGGGGPINDGGLAMTAAGEEVVPDAGDTELAWTGTSASGVRSAPYGTCSSWASQVNGGAVGRVGATNAEWTDRPGAAACAQAYRLYCFQRQ